MRRSEKLTSNTCKQLPGELLDLAAREGYKRISLEEVEYALS
jgi:hypothetical protein